MNRANEGNRKHLYSKTFMVFHTRKLTEGVKEEKGKLKRKSQILWQHRLRLASCQHWFLVIRHITTEMFMWEILGGNDKFCLKYKDSLEVSGHLCPIYASITLMLCILWSLGLLSQTIFKKQQIRGSRHSVTVLKHLVKTLVHTVCWSIIQTRCPKQLPPFSSECLNSGNRLLNSMGGVSSN